MDSTSSGTSLSGGSGTAAPDPLLAQHAQFFSRSGFQACLVGGGGAAILASLIKGRIDRNAVIAGVATCGVAMGANYYLEARRTQYANNEQRMNSYINDVRNDNNQISSLISDTNQVIEKNKAQVEQIKAQLAAKQITLQEANKQLANLDGNIAFLRKAEASYRNKLQEYQKTAAAERQQGVSDPALDAQIADMKKRIDELELKSVQLSDLRTISAAG